MKSRQKHARLVEGVVCAKRGSVNYSVEDHGYITSVVGCSRESDSQYNGDDG